MSTAQLKNSVVTPSTTEVMLAKNNSLRLAPMLGEQSEYQIQLVDNGHVSEAFTIPAIAMRLLVEALSEIGHGHAVTLLPIHTELSTQQAADLLNVSRPYLIGLLEKGDIPFHKVGAHRRVQLRDILLCKQANDTARLKVLDELVEQAQRLNMGY